MAFQLKKASTTTYDLILLVADSTKDPFLGDIASTKRITDVVGFYVDGKAVGFAIPRRDSDGRYRTGAIYITPNERKKGYAKQYLILYFQNKAGRAYIEPSNTASQSLFASVGFTKSGKTLKADNDLFEEWLLNPQSPSAFKW